MKRFNFLRFLGILAPTLGMSIVCFLPYHAMQSIRGALTEVADSYRMQKELLDVTSSYQDASRNLRSYLRTGNPEYWQEYLTSHQAVMDEWDQLKRVSENQTDLQLGVSQLGSILRSQFDQNKRLGKTHWESNASQVAMELIDRDMLLIQTQIADLMNHQEAMLQKSLKLRERREQSSSVMFEIVSLMSVGLVMQLVFVLRRELAHRLENETLSRALYEQAQAANRAKSMFLAQMSHEIRTPMTAIIGFSELLAQPQTKPDEHSKYVDIIYRNARSLLKIINDILDLSKVEAGAIEVVREPFRLRTECAEWMSGLELSARDKGLDLQLAWDEEVPQMLLIDALRLRQIFVNLVGNSIKFTSAGGVSIKVSWKPRVRSQEGKLIFEIRDTGRGVPLDARERIFEPFKQADRLVNRDYGGTGLGLPLSRQLARLLGGDVELIESEIGQGSLFVLSLACQSLEEKTSLKSELPALSEAFSTHSMVLKGKRILLAEDALDIQFLIRRLLSLVGAQVMVVGNGQDAIAQASSETFDAVLMDIQMPGCDGVKATQTLRSQGFKPPIIALTAHGMKEEHDQALASGCNACLTKPISQQQLVKTLLVFLSPT